MKRPTSQKGRPSQQQAPDHDSGLEPRPCQTLNTGYAHGKFDSFDADDGGGKPI